MKDQNLQVFAELPNGNIEIFKASVNIRITGLYNFYDIPLALIVTNTISLELII